MFRLGDNPIVPAKLFALNRDRLVGALRESNDVPERSVVLLGGGESKTRYNTDSDDAPFRQVGSFSCKMVV